MLFRAADLRLLDGAQFHALHAAFRLRDEVDMLDAALTERDGPVKVGGITTDRRTKMNAEKSSTMSITLSQIDILAPLFTDMKIFGSNIFFAYQFHNLEPNPYHLPIFHALMTCFFFRRSY